MIHGHGGNIYAMARSLGCRPEEIADMSSNVNPYGPMPELIEHLAGVMHRIGALPEPDAESIVAQVAARHDLPPSQVIAGNGSTQLIYTLPRALNARRVLIVAPTYADYADACRQNGIAPVVYQYWHPSAPLTPEHLAAAARDHDTVILCNPNNPTGAMIDGSELATLCRLVPGTVFVIDESYLPFVADAEERSVVPKLAPNMVVIQSLSKIFRVPGLRIGFAMGHRDIIARLRQLSMPWSVNALAQAAVAWLFTHTGVADRFVRDSRERLAGERDRFVEAFAGNDRIRWFPSETAFVLGEVGGGHTAATVAGALAKHRFLVRDCSNFVGLSERFMRVSMKTPEVNDRLVAVLNDVLAAEPESVAGEDLPELVMGMPLVKGKLP